MSLWGSRITTRTSPPTRRSTEASVVSQSCAACHQRRSTSSLVHASNTAWAGARKVRSMRSVVVSFTSRAPGGGARGGLSTHAPPEARCRCRRAPAAAPPAAELRCGRSPVLGRDIRAEPGLGVVVVVVPPAVWLGPGVALRRVLPLLLAAQRGHVEVGPRCAHRLVAPAVDEVGAVDVVVVVAVEGVVAVPLVHVKVGIEV